MTDQQDAPFSDRALDGIPDDMDLDELADASEQTLQERLLDMMRSITENVLELPDFDYEVGAEGRKVTFR